MAYNFNEVLNADGERAFTRIDGKTYTTFEIIEGDVTPTDEWKITGLPKIFTITLFEAELVTAGTATTIDPDLGTKDSFSLNTVDTAVTNATAAVWINSMSDARVNSPAGILVGRSTPDTGTATKIRTRVTFREGH